MKRVCLAKTGAVLRGVASLSLVAACERDPEGKTLAVYDPALRFKEGGTWYPVLPEWKHANTRIVFVDDVGGRS